MTLACIPSRWLDLARDSLWIVRLVAEEPGKRKPLPRAGRRLRILLQHDDFEQLTHAGSIPGPRIGSAADFFGYLKGRQSRHPASEIGVSICLICMVSAEGIEPSTY